MNLCHKQVVLPLISLRPPSGSREDAIFIPTNHELLAKRSTNGATEHAGNQREITAERGDLSLIRKQNKKVSFDLKPNNKQFDPSDFSTLRHTSNKENYVNLSNIHVIARTFLARNNTVREISHAFDSGVVMSSKTEAKKLKETSVSSQRKVNRESQGRSSEKVEDGSSKAGKKVQGKNVIRGVTSEVHGPGLPKMKDGAISKYATPGSKDKQERKPIGIKPQGKKPSSPSSPLTGQKSNPSTVRDVKDGRPEIGRVKRVEKTVEQSSLTGMADSYTRPRGQGTKVSTPKGRKQYTNHVTQNAAMMLPKVSISEVLQSWKIEQPRNRSSSLAVKDPMEFLRRDRSLSDSERSPKTYDDLRRCRYLRVGKEDGQDVHASFCSCNSCEHGEGLKSTNYLNS